MSVRKILLCSASVALMVLLLVCPSRSQPVPGYCLSNPDSDFLFFFLTL